MSVHPILQYVDPDAALAWLEEAFGFEPLGITRDDDGRVRHAELRAGGGVVMISGGDARKGQGWVYVALDEVDSVHDRAVAAGAEITMALTDQDYGSRDFGAQDLEGNDWAFGTYRP